MKEDKQMEIDMEDAPLIRPEENNEKMLGSLESPYKGTKSKGSGLKGKNNHKGMDAESSSSCCGFFLGLFLAASIFFCWFVLFICNDFVGAAEGEDRPLVLTSDHLPLINRNKTIIYVARPEGLPIAYNFVLDNPQIPIEKLIYKPPGLNSTLTVFPIPRGELGNLLQQRGDMQMSSAFRRRSFSVPEVKMSLGIVSIAFALLCLCIICMYSCRDSVCNAFAPIGESSGEMLDEDDMSLAETILEVAAYFEDEVMREKKVALEKYKQKQLASKKLKEKDGADKPLLA